jgi:flagellar biosynthesis component FlhA
MDSSVEIAVIGGSTAVLVSILSGLFAAFAASSARRAAERAEKLSHETKEVTTNTAKAIDGRMTEMLELTKKLAYKAGMQDQKQQTDTIAAAVKDAATPTVVIAQPQIRPEIERQERGE